MLITIASSAFSQQIQVIYSSGPALLAAGGVKHGDIQWQSSPDLVAWTDVAGWNSDTISFVPSTTLTYYRAKITSGTCNVIYSDIQGLRRFNCGDSLVDDRDAQIYPTVQIGTQCWMGRNMNIGTMIYGHLNMQNDSIIEKYCYVNDTNSCNTYGALYQWDEMMQYINTPGSRGICPKGFHIPTDQEILSLEIYLGMNPSIANLMNTWRGTDEGTKIKQGGSSGFNANLPGVRYDGGLFYMEGTFEFIFTSDTNFSAPTMALRRCINNSDPTIGRYNNTSKTMGASARCIMNP